MERALMERVLVRYGGQRAENLQGKDDASIVTLVQHLKVRMVIPDSQADLVPVNLDDVLLRAG